MQNESDKKTRPDYQYHQSDSALHVIFNTIAEPVFIIDCEGTILDANLAFAKIFGRQVQECLNVSVYDLLPSRLAASRKEKAEEALRTHLPVIFEDERDGLFIRHSINPIIEKDGTISRLYIISQDVTELKLVQKESKNHQIFSDSLIEAMPGAFYMLDAEGRFVGWNAYERDIIVGKSESEMCTCYAIDTIHPDDRARIAEKMKRVMQYGIEESDVMKVLLHGGPVFRWFRVSGKRIIIDNNSFLIGIGADITDHKKAAEYALKNSDDRFRTLFQEHSSIMLVIDPITHNIIDANYSAADFYGWSVEELKRMRAEQISMSSMECIMDDIYNSTISKKNKFASIHKMANGSVRDVEVTMNAIFIKNKELIYAIINDITERKKIENALQESEKKFRSITEQMSEMVFVSDLKGYVTYVSPKVEEFAGYKPDEVIGHLFTEFLSEEDISRAVEQFTDALSHHLANQVLEFKYRKKNGIFIDAEVHAQYFDNNGSAGVIGLIHDITERKRAEKQLQKLSAAIQQSPAVVVITDPFGDIEYVNPMFTILTGYSAEEVIGKNPRILQSGMTHEDVYKNLWKTILSGDIWRGEFQNRKKNGEFFWETAVISAILNNNGVITNFVAVKEDITEQKKMFGELIEAKQKAEESDRLKSAFLANISHEIRTPMNGILGFAQLLKEPCLSGEEQVEYINLIQQSGERMLSLINNLINISRIEAGEMMEYITATPVNELLRDLYAFFKPEMNKKGLLLNCITPLPDSESIIQTDSGKLAQILTNLIQNALKFTSKGEIDFGYNLEDRTLEFYVIDTGIGIAEDMKETIFDRFHQVDNPLTRTYEGAGLGLSISKAYVEMLGGTIRIESKEGVGSEFYFTLPCNFSGSKVNPVVLPAARESFESFADLVVLIVDDDEISSLLLLTTLKSLNLTTLTAINGQEAVVMVDQHPQINLVLMDVKMPLMNGYEATTLIKKLRPELPVIVQTAFTSKEEEAKAKEAGCDGFISKPINTNDLLALMKKLLKS